jgi:hypothetical protein
MCHSACSTITSVSAARWQQAREGTGCLMTRVFPGAMDGSVLDPNRWWPDPPPPGVWVERNWQIKRGMADACKRCACLLTKSRALANMTEWRASACTSRSHIGSIARLQLATSLVSAVPLVVVVVYSVEHRPTCATTPLPKLTQGLVPHTPAQTSC